MTDTDTNVTLSVWILKDAEVSLSLAARRKADCQIYSSNHNSLSGVISVRRTTDQYPTYVNCAFWLAKDAFIFSCANIKHLLQYACNYIFLVKEHMGMFQLREKTVVGKTSRYVRVDAAAVSTANFWPPTVYAILAIYY